MLILQITNNNDSVCVVAELDFDKHTHRKLFSGEIEFERFYLFSHYASQNKFMHLVNVFMDKMIELL